MRFILLFFAIAATTAATAQDTIYFKEALSVAAPHRYGREAIYTDELAWRMVNGSLQKPVAGAMFGMSERGDSLVWQSVTADSANRLRSRMRGGFGGFGRGGGYTYLTYNADRARTALLNIRGNSGFFINGEPHAGDPYNSGWLYIPVKLRKGMNELYVRGLFITASLIFPKTPVSIVTEDATLPHIIPGNDNTALRGAVVVINSTDKTLKNYQVRSSLNGNDLTETVPDIPPMSTRKIAFRFNGGTITQKGLHNAQLQLLANGKVVDQKEIRVEAVNKGEQYSSTFVSNIDGSLQYYAVTPQSGQSEDPALFLSVHGAGVEAIGQARAYKPKDWGTLVAATNRRPRGFNWEDWGRLDALEVLSIAKDRFKPHPQRVYLTGHSMGGHGTWFLGATYPDKWAAIAPCAGYPTLKGYGSADGLIPDSSRSDMEQILLRSSNQSDMIRLATNYKPLGVYIFHGDADRVVPVTYARQMKKVLSEFHSDMSYYEYPGGEHWFGDISVDWQPIFDFFKWHKRAVDSAVNKIDFMTASPGISSSYYWASIEQQDHPLSYSRMILDRNRTSGTISGKLENVRLLKLSLNDFAANKALKIQLDSLNTVEYTTKSANDSVFLIKSNNQWSLTSKPALTEKGPHRYGTLKDAFNHNMVYVYGTSGNKQENEWNYNKARYDAETWYYRGNGAIDIISDKEFNADSYAGRGVILYGNASTNSAWNQLLSDCPIQVQRNQVKAGDQVWNGDDLAAYFVWPLKNSPVTSVAVISGTGAKGNQAALGNQYFAGASGFPDFMIFGFDMLKDGAAGVKMAGFFDNAWKMNKDNLIVNK